MKVLSLPTVILVRSIHVTERNYVSLNYISDCIKKKTNHIIDMMIRLITQI